MPEAITESLIKACNAMLNYDGIAPGFQGVAACLLWAEALWNTSFHGTKVGLQRMELGAGKPFRWKIALVKEDLPGMNGGCMLAVAGSWVSWVQEAAGGGVAGEPG